MLLNTKEKLTYSPRKKKKTEKKELLNLCIVVAHLKSLGSKERSEKCHKFHEAKTKAKSGEEMGKCDSTYNLLRHKSNINVHSYRIIMVFLMDNVFSPRGKKMLLVKNNVKT
jgi:hypothetical protein